MHCHEWAANRRPCSARENHLRCAAEEQPEKGELLVCAGHQYVSLHETVSRKRGLAPTPGTKQTHPQSNREDHTDPNQASVGACPVSSVHPYTFLKVSATVFIKVNSAV